MVNASRPMPIFKFNLKNSKNLWAGLGVHFLWAIYRWKLWYPAQNTEILRNRQKHIQADILLLLYDDKSLIFIADSPVYIMLAFLHVNVNILVFSYKI